MASKAELFEAGFLHKIIGVRPGTTGKELKEACQRARLRNHPDKGGDTEIFKIVETTVQLLLNELPSCADNAPLLLRALRIEIDELRLVFDRGLGGNVKQLQHLREEYKKAFLEYQQHLEEVEERRAREQIQRERRAREARELQEHIDRINKMFKESTLIQVLLKRCSRKPSTQFPSLPPGSTNARYKELHQRYRSLGQLKCKRRKQDKDVAGIEDERAAVLHEVRGLVNTHIAHACKQHQVHTNFPRRARTHPSYESLEPLRQSYRKLKDLARTYPQRDHLERAGVILRQAWELVSLGLSCFFTSMNLS